MRKHFSWLCVIAFIVPVLVRAQEPTFSFTTSSQRVCPGSTTLVGSIVMQNSGATAGTIPAGKTYSFVFDAPVLSSPVPVYNGPGTPSMSFSGNVLNLTYALPTTVAGGQTLTLSGVALNMTGVADGTAISVEGDGFVATAGRNTGNVAVSAPIVPNPSSLTYTAPAGGANPAAQNVSLSGSGAQFVYSASASTMSGGVWLSVSPTTGPGTTLNVAVNSSGLAQTTYTGAVRISDAVGNACSSIAVTVTVVIPNLVTTPTALTYSASTTDNFVPVQTLTIGANTGTLSWTATAATQSGGNWLTVNPNQGTTPTTINVQVVSIPSTPGVYQGSVTIVSATAQNSPLVVPVTLNISSAPIIHPSATTLSFSMSAGGTTPPSQTFQVTNEGAGTLTFQALAVTQSGGAWLSVSPTSATAPATLTVSVNPSPGGTALAAGTYNGTVQLTSSGAANTPQGVAVTLTINAVTAATISLAPASMQFTTTPGADPPAPQNLQISNTGTTGSTLGWTATVSTTDGLNWLSAFPLTGVAPSTLQISVNSKRLAAGTYSGSVRIDATAASNANNTPQTLNVTLAVGTPLVSQGGVVNGASFAANTAVGPGGIVSIFGTNLASQVASASSLPLPTTLSNVQVMVNGTVKAPLFYVSPAQINLQMPVEATGTSATLMVTNGTLQGNPVTVSMNTEAPGIFTVAASGSGQAAALNADSSPNSGSNPAAGGTTVSLFATGLGVTNPAFATGQTGATAEPLNRTVQNPVVTVNGVAAAVTYSGLAPGFVGLYQVNVVVPQGTPAGSTVPVSLTINGKTANAVTIAVK